jgi:hypothetical protein
VLKIFFTSVKNTFNTVSYKEQFLIKLASTKNVTFNVSCINSYLYSKAAKSYFDEPREKLSSRPRCGRDKRISRSSKDFVAKVYTTFCVQPENEQVKFPSLSIKIKSAYMSPCRYGNDINKTIHFEKNWKNVARKLQRFCSVYFPGVKKYCRLCSVQFNTRKVQTAVR